MSRSHEDREPAIEITDLDGTLPPPSAALLTRIEADGGTRLRRPVIDWLVQLAAWALIAGGFVGAIGLRPDRVGLSLYALAGVASAWMVLVAIMLAALLLPSRGQVLPSLRRARLAAFVTPVLAMSIALGLLVDAAGFTQHPDAAHTAHALAHCLGLGLFVALPAGALGWWTLRALFPLGAPWGAAALGACAGALGAFVLHLVCPVGGALHVGVGHGGVVLAAALLAAALGARPTRGFS